MTAKQILILHMVPIALTFVIAAAVLLSTPVYAIAPKKSDNIYLLFQNTVWAANHHLVITPTLMQLDADHPGFAVQYSIPDQEIIAWNKIRKEYCRQPLQSWLKSFRNLAVILSWSSGLQKPNEVTTVKAFGKKAKHYVWNDVKVQRSFYSSDIGKPERNKPPASGNIKTVQLDGVDPTVGLVLTRIYGFPESKEIPIEAYMIREKRKTHESIHTFKLEVNPKIKLPSLFVPPKGYKQIKDFQRVLAPQDTDVNGIF